MSKTVIELTTPIEAHGETLKTLELRELTTEDIMRCGFPFAPNANGEDVEIKASVAAKYIVRLAGIPESSVKSLSPLDFIKVCGEILSFFGESTGER
jgi:hypothetical protein